jgi:serine/threonine protein kinase
MTPAEYQQAVGLFEQLRELPESQRASALDLACAGNTGLREQVWRLLQADRDAAAGLFLARRAIEDAAGLLKPDPPNAPARGTVTGNYRLSPLSPGTRFGPYEITALLGAGGMGEVYRARDARLGREVALKILAPEVANDPTRRQRFELEARVVAALNHPNIVAVYDVGEGYIVSELVEGEPLRGGHLGLRKTIEIAAQIAGGLAAAHDAGIVHRDLKPDNILLAHDGRPRILDFGLARVGAAHAVAVENGMVQTETGMVMGTAGYMSP